MRILVTGATGFIGRTLIDHLLKRDEYTVLGTARNVEKCVEIKGLNFFSVGDMSIDKNWLAATQGVDVVIHLAARAHIIDDLAADPLTQFRSVNVAGTLALARQALASGVKRFIFMSSIGVNGSQISNQPFNEFSLPNPHAHYALSKLEAEEGLRNLLQGTAMEFVFIRPPLVYDGNAPGNFQRLLKLVASGIPLPFSSILNKRSIVALENLIDFVMICIEHPLAANELFLISDGTDVSTSEIIRYIAEGMEHKANLFRCPDIFLRAGATLVGRPSIYTQLCSSLTINSHKAQQLLDWQPTFSTPDGLRKAGADYLAGSRG